MGGDEPQDCPVCGSSVEKLLRLDGGFKLRLRESGQPEPVPEQACESCYSRFTEVISEGAQIRAKESAKQQNRVSMWRNRMSLIKQARTKMENKNFAEAAVLYEKYLRVLEIIYDVEAGKIEPSLFQNKARKKELTLITSVLWDLARIYDSSGQYLDRLERTIKKLVTFAPHSGIIVMLSKNVANYQRLAKNRDAFRLLERELGIKPARCFIATAVFESEESPEVIKLRDFRDRHLMTHFAGRVFVQFYYLFSPRFVPFIKRSNLVKKAIKRLLKIVTDQLT